MIKYNKVKEEFFLNKQIKIKILLLLFRISSARYSSRILYIILLPIHVLYYIYSNFLLGIEIPASTKIGMPFIIWHGVGIVINPSCVIGENVIIRNGVVIGNNGKSDKCPVIEDNCSLGANSVIIGDIVISPYCKIGPCCFVNYSIKEKTKVINCTLIK